MADIDLDLFDTETLRALTKGIELPDSITELETRAADLNDTVRPRGFGFGPKDYWSALKTEMFLLICGGEGSEKYADLRQTLARHGKKSQTALVSTIAVFVGSEIAVEAGLLTPYVAMMLAVASRVGREAFCEAIRGGEAQ